MPKLSRCQNCHNHQNDTKMYKMEKRHKYKIFLAKIICVKNRGFLSCLYKTTLTPLKLRRISLKTQVAHKIIGIQKWLVAKKMKTQILVVASEVGQKTLCVVFYGKDCWFVDYVCAAFSNLLINLISIGKRMIPDPTALNSIQMDLEMKAPYYHLELRRLVLFRISNEVTGWFCGFKNKFQGLFRDRTAVCSYY